MLSEIVINNFAIIDQINIQLGPGFNVLTGETGAGKSIIIDAVSTLLGSRAATDAIRAGAERARIEGVYQLSPALYAKLSPILSEYGLEDDQDILILAREINRSGRNTCRVNGRATTLSVLRQISQHLVDIHGQGENHSLLRVRQHIGFLDRYAGLETKQSELAAAVRALRQTRQELANLLQSERELARRIDLLEYQTAEIRAAHLQPGEEGELVKERTRLANAERLSKLAADIYAALSGEDGETQSGLDLLNEAMRSLVNLQELDPETAEIHQLVEGSIALIEEASRAVRDYRDNVEYNPARLEQVEERLGLIHNLERKYGDSIEEVLQFAQEAEDEMADIAHHGERVNGLAAQEESLLRQIGELGENLSIARRRAALDLKSAIESELAELLMPRAQFDVSFQRTETKDGAYVGDKRYAFDLTGIDRIEFLISPNIGEPPKPLASIASGGETSRLMLAMKSVLSAVDETPTLIFDEIDAGIGGRAGRIVGQKLWRVARNHQVLCVTHLPQMAAFGDVHYRVFKGIQENRTVTTVKVLDETGRVAELAMMLGGYDNQTTLRNAEEILSATRELKEATQHS